MKAPRSISSLAASGCSEDPIARVRGLEHAQARLAAGAQQRRVGALVELDLVGEVLRCGLGDGRRETVRRATATATP